MQKLPEINASELIDIDSQGYVDYFEKTTQQDLIIGRLLSDLDGATHIILFRKESDVKEENYGKYEEIGHWTRVKRLGKLDYDFVLTNPAITNFLYENQAYLDFLDASVAYHNPYNTIKRCILAEIEHDKTACATVVIKKIARVFEWSIAYVKSVLQQLIQEGVVILTADDIIKNPN